MLELSFPELLPRNYHRIFTDKVCTAESPTSTKGTLLDKPATNNQTRGATAARVWCLKAIEYLYFELAGFHQYTTPLGSESLVQPVAASLLYPSLSSSRLCCSLPSSSPLYSLPLLCISLYGSPNFLTAVSLPSSPVSLTFM